tara:strand:- start:54 stop:320 length:267 start_codon:yes stop_codon:yes gene_type:complete
LAFTPLKGVTMAVPVPRTLEAMAGLEASVAVVDEYAKVDCDGSVDLICRFVFFCDLFFGIVEIDVGWLNKKKMRKSLKRIKVRERCIV